MLPYPPFGLITLSFLGISSYLLLVGIYNSAISISLDHKIRSSIHNSLEQELKFISKIGSSQMQHKIENKVKRSTKQFSSELEEYSGIKVLMEKEEMDKYIRFVLKEKEMMSERKRDP